MTQKIFLKSSLAFILAWMLTQVHAQKMNAEDLKYGTWGHGQAISNEIIKGLPFIRGWNFTYSWREIETDKGKFNWKTFDNNLKIAADNNLYIGFMIWVGQNSPEWIYTKDSVPKVVTRDKKHDVPYYPYYFSPAYKTDYFNLMKTVIEHVNTLPPAVRNKVLFWMSAEGTTGDETPYKGIPVNSNYNISEAQWFDFKKEAWSYMYKSGKSLTPQLNVLINQANNGRYLDWLLQNCPGAWFKAGSLAHTYQFNRELDYVNRLKKVVRSDNNGNVNRFRSESEEVQQLGWYNQSPAQNSFMIAASSLHIGLDIMNVRKNAVKEADGYFSFRFFNRYAGQRDPATASGAFCLLRDVLDVTDTKRFPVAKYGAINSNTSPEKADANTNEEGDEMRLQIRSISTERKQNIVKEFAKYGAQVGATAQQEAVIYKDEGMLPAKLQKDNLRPDLQDKYNADIGINLIPDNYSRFLTQYEPNTTSRGYWRVGPADQPYGRYARGFDNANGMKEMWFALDKNFFPNNHAPHKLKISIAYFDKGNGQWSLNYSNAKGETEKYRVQCKGANKWIVKEVDIDDAYTDKKLPHATDFSLKYVSGDNTIFSLIEVTRL